MTIKKKEKDGWGKYDMSDPKQKEEAHKKIQEKIDKKYPVEKKKKKTEKTTPKMKEEIASDLINKLPPPEEKNKPPKGPGRKEKITENILQKLKVCFAVGMTDPQACYFCQISERTLYNYQIKNPEFVQEKEILKTSISLQAKFNIGRTIKIEEAKAYGGTGNSWKWLEKKDPEFKEKLQIDGNIEIGLTKEQKEKEEKLLNKLKNFLVG